MKYEVKELNAYTMQITVEYQYRDYIIFGIPGYFRYRSLSGTSISIKHWKTLNGITKAIDKEYNHVGL